jgi:hypothetical protein
MNMVVDGHTGVEHALPCANVYDDVKQLGSQTDVGYTPTLGVAYGGLDGEHYFRRPPTSGSTRSCRASCRGRCSRRAGAPRDGAGRGLERGERRGAGDALQQAA